MGCKNCGKPTDSTTGLCGECQWKISFEDDDDKNAALKKRVAELEEASRWREVAKGELPEKVRQPKRYDVVVESIDRMILWFDADDGKWYDRDSEYTVTHWRPLSLPAAPKEAADECPICGGTGQKSVEVLDGIMTVACDSADCDANLKEASEPKKHSFTAWIADHRSIADIAEQFFNSYPRVVGKTKREFKERAPLARPRHITITIEEGK